jgi:kumamolisin
MTGKTHVELSGSNRDRDPSSFRVGEIDPKVRVIVTVGLRGPELPGVDEFVGQTMTPEELAEKYGARKADADKAGKSLEKFGLKVEEVSLATRSMRVGGTAQAMEAAFKPDWAIMRSPRQGAYRSRHGTIQIPKDLKGIVTGVFGLDQRRMAHRRSGASVPAGCGAGLSPLTPADIEKCYNFPDGDGKGQSIAIAEFGGGYFKEDMKAYCNKFGRSTPNVQPISVDAPAYTLQDILNIQNPELRKLQLDESFEVMMDVEIIGGLCPKANISVYFSEFTLDGWIHLLDRVIAARPVPAALSISWGHAEDDSWTANGIQDINNKLNIIRLLGITTCVASGDDGSRDQVYDGRAHVDFPASSPHVMGVGGTMLVQSGGNVQEVTWWDNPGYLGGATGGGVSKVFPRPVWQDVQVASITPGSIDGRVVPDVSALAGMPYYDLVFAGFPWPDGKTSASAPVWAALIARMSATKRPTKRPPLPLRTRQPFLTPLLYKRLANGKAVAKASFRDITTGNNKVHPTPGGYNAGAGFDAVTGWGVPDGKKLLKCLAQI